MNLKILCLSITLIMFSALISNAVELPGNDNTTSSTNIQTSRLSFTKQTTTGLPNFRYLSTEKAKREVGPKEKKRGLTMIIGGSADAGVGLIATIIGSALLGYGYSLEQSMINEVGSTGNSLNDSLASATTSLVTLPFYAAGAALLVVGLLAFLSGAAVLVGGILYFTGIWKIKDKKVSLFLENNMSNDSFVTGIKIKV